MSDQTKHSRRTVIQSGMMALVAVPLVGFSTRSLAAQNAAVRQALKYQLTPSGDKQCSVCVNFIANKDKPVNDQAINGCKLYPGDSEICPRCGGSGPRPRHETIAPDLRRDGG
jgi:RNA polymerase subunit RPABC4/transcription elongation factor Spt4